MKALESFGMFLGRLAISSVFLYGATSKIMYWDATVQYMEAKGMTMVPLFLLVALIVELLGGLALLFGYKTRWAAALLLLFLIPVTGIFHDFWNADEAHRQIDTILFLKNVAIFGGLLYVASCGSGKCSVDACCCKESCQTPKK